MAKNPEPVPIEMSPELVARLRAMKPDVEKAKASLELLKELGVDARALEQNVEYAERVMKTISKRIPGGL